jgi:alpha-D-ribose 1-methylphosphonate 5-triphosphate synthase subunit PhnG
VVVGENAATRTSGTMVYESLLDLPAWADVQDEEIVERIRAGETGLYEIFMRRHNQGCTGSRFPFCGMTPRLKTSCKRRTSAHTPI